MPYTPSLPCHKGAGSQPSRNIMHKGMQGLSPKQGCCFSLCKKLKGIIKVSRTAGSRRVQDCALSCRMRHSLRTVECSPRHAARRDVPSLQPSIYAVRLSFCQTTGNSDG